MADETDDLEYSDTNVGSAQAQGVRKNISLKLKGKGRGRGRRAGKTRRSSTKKGIDDNDENADPPGDIAPSEKQFADTNLDEVISKLDKTPAFSPMDRPFPEPMHQNKKLRWDHKVNLIGEKVMDPLIHCCEKCSLPILNYGRMIPCKHVFCLDCAKKFDKICGKCDVTVQRVEQSILGTVFMCTFGGSRHVPGACGRTYLSQRDLQAHVNHRHLKTASSSSGIDLEYESEARGSLAPELALYETCYVTSHKNPCRAGAFSSDGQLVATGSVDTSIKILDVDRMLAKSSTPAEIAALETPQQNMENHPVIRTLYDHVEEVTTLEFHPTEQILVSGSADMTVKFFDYSKPSAKRAYKTIREAEAVRCVALHPSGDYILIGTHHPVLRLYDVRTSQCFVSDSAECQHTKPINMIKYSNNANIYATCSKDGNIKLWDGVSNRCINTFKSAHDGTEVSSIQFSRNSKYLLSSGKDSVVKLWELSVARCLIKYTGAGSNGKAHHRSQAVFNHTEDYVLFPNEKTVSLCSWNSRNADRLRLLSLGHNSNVRHIVHSPVSPSFITCSDDCRARFWYRRTDSGH